MSKDRELELLSEMQDCFYCPELPDVVIQSMGAGEASFRLMSFCATHFLKAKNLFNEKGVDYRVFIFSHRENKSW